MSTTPLTDAAIAEACRMPEVAHIVILGDKMGSLETRLARLEEIADGMVDAIEDVGDWGGTRVGEHVAAYRAYKEEKK